MRISKAIFMLAVEKLGVALARIFFFFNVAFGKMGEALTWAFIQALYT